PSPPEAMGAGANRGVPEGESGERRISVRLLTEAIEQIQPSVDLTYLVEQALNASNLNIFGPDALPLPPLKISLESDATESSDAELIARARMVGIYESQIRARIERAWALPP